MTGSPEVTAAVIASGSVNVDDGDHRGSTPLMYCSLKGYTPVARVLLDKGADVSRTDVEGFSAMHVAAQSGHLEVVKLLMKASRASLDAKMCDGSTPLHLSSQKGNCEVIRTLIKAGANINSRTQFGATPLYLATEERQLLAIKELLRAGADPRVVADERFVALDMATQNGDTAVVRELVERVGIRRCGGDSCGAQALRLAAEEQHIDIMLILVAAGVVDTNTGALCGAAEYGRAGSMKLLLEKFTRRSAGVRAYVNSRVPQGTTPLLASVAGCRPGAARVARMLVEAGADTAAAAPAVNCFGVVYFNGTPLALATALLRAKQVGGKPATEQQMRAIKAVRRFLLTADAVHAVSWLWTVDAPRRHTIAHHAAAEGAASGGQAAPSMQPALMLPTLRRRAGNRAVLLAGLFR